MSWVRRIETTPEPSDSSNKWTACDDFAVQVESAKQKEEKEEDK